MLVTASCWRECTRCFCFASPSTFAFTWATVITIHINSCPVKYSRDVAGSGHFVDGRLTGRYPAGFHGGISPLKSASVYRRFGAVRSAIVPEAIQIAVHQSVEKMPEHSVTNRRGLSFRQMFSQKTLDFCTIRVCSLVENSGTRTTFLLRSPKTEKEQPLTH